MPNRLWGSNEQLCFGPVFCLLVSIWNSSRSASDAFSWERSSLSMMSFMFCYPREHSALHCIGLPRVSIKTSRSNCLEHVKMRSRQPLIFTCSRQIGANSPPRVKSLALTAHSKTLPSGIMPLRIAIVSHAVVVREIEPLEKGMPKQHEPRQLTCRWESYVTTEHEPPKARSAAAGTRNRSKCVDGRTPLRHPRA